MKFVMKMFIQHKVFNEMTRSLTLNDEVRVK